MRMMSREQALGVLEDTLSVWSAALARGPVELRLSVVPAGDHELALEWSIPGLPPIDPVVVRVMEDGRVAVPGRVLEDAIGALLWLAWEQASWVYDLPQLPDLGPLPDSGMAHTVGG